MDREEGERGEALTKAQKHEGTLCVNTACLLKHRPVWGTGIHENHPSGLKEAPETRDPAKLSSNPAKPVRKTPDTGNRGIRYRSTEIWNGEFRESTVLPLPNCAPSEWKSLPRRSSRPVSWSRRNICPLVFTAASFTIAKTRKQAKDH